MYTLEFIVDLLNSIKLRQKGWKKKLNQFLVHEFVLDDNIPKEIADVIDEFYMEVDFYIPYFILRVFEPDLFGQDKLFVLVEETISKLQKFGVEF